VSDPADGDVPKGDIVVPPTRKLHVAGDAATGEPPARESHLSLDNIPVGFPDDGPISRIVRGVDHKLGVAEQVALVAIFAIVVLVASYTALHDKLAELHLGWGPEGHVGRWWHYIVRGGTFVVAMGAAAFCTQQQRHLAMDLISRRLPPRGRLVLGMVLRLVTIAAAIMLALTGYEMSTPELVGGSESLDFFGLHIIDADIVKMVPIGAVLIAVHCALHVAIDVDYLARGKLPPERARSGH